MAAFLLYKIRVSKGGFTFVDWQVAQSRVFFLPKSQKQSQLCARYQLLSYEQIFDTLISIRNAVLRLSMEVVLPVEWKCFVRGQMRNDRYGCYGNVYMTDQRLYKLHKFYKFPQNWCRFLQPEEKKLSTSKKVEISKKRSYTRSYKRYPQKKSKNYRFTQQKKRTEVLYTNNKVDKFVKKRRKSLDFFKVKILRKLSENVINVSKIYRRILSLDRQG